MRRVAALRVLVILLLTLSVSCLADELGVDRGRWKAILKNVAADIQHHFYDPKLNGLDLQKALDEASQKIDHATSVNAMNAAIYEFTEKLDDSHTVFLQPLSGRYPEYGFEAKPFGEEIFVFDVEEKGAAARAGLKPGDKIIQLEGLELNRDNYDRILFYARNLYFVSPLRLVVAHPNGKVDEISVKPNIRIRPAIVGGFLHFNGLWNMYTEAQSYWLKHYTLHAGVIDQIAYLDVRQLDESKLFMEGFVGHATGAKALVIDLRDCPGGFSETLKNFAGMFETEQQTMARLIGRDKTEPMRIEPQKPHIQIPTFVLVDSGSASAAEMFARYLQLRHKATIVGDRTMGAVTTSLTYEGQTGAMAVHYATSVGVARVEMMDGQGLEKVGVTPDVSCVPSGADLASNKDSCLELVFSLAKKATAEPAKTASGN